ncbi:MAG: FadR family transcriptional regulator, partial [Bauldia sp.]|nr:FadR family transcriptional regulator [Bauldia sp.]
MRRLIMSLSHPGSRPLRAPRNLTSELASRLSEEIVAGKLAPGTRLPTEHELMRSFGVSRTVVREAIAALRSEGLVETRQGSGAFVAADSRRRPFRIDPEGLESVEQVLDVLELRICVEVEAAGLAAERRSKADIARITEICGAFGRAIETGDEAADLDFDFHAAIGAATRNP